MATSIFTRIIGTQDKKLVLENSQWAATMDIGANWSRIWVAGRLCWRDTSGDIINNPRIWLGLLAGPSNNLPEGPLGLTTSHFVGERISSATMVRVVSGIAMYRFTFVGLKRVGAIDTTAGGNLQTHISATAATHRTGFIIEFTKGSPNWVVDIIAPDIVSGAVDTPFANLKIAMSDFNVLAGTGSAADYLEGITGGAWNESLANVPVNEATNGNLTSICLAWNKTETQVEFSEIGYSIKE